MAMTSEWSELLRLFNENGVEYVIVDGYAMAFHGAPRMTGDLDLFVRPERKNAKRIVKSLADFGFTSLQLTEEDFLINDKVIQLGYPPLRVDLITSLDGVTSDEVFAGKVSGNFAGEPVYYIGRRELVANKRATGRKRDIADLEELGE